MEKGRQDGKGVRGVDSIHRISFGLGERDFQSLSELAAYHGRTPEALILDALPRVFEKYRVLRLLRERSGKQGGAAWPG